MSPTTTKVALAGATGNLGAPILTGLLEAGHSVVVLTRIGSTSTSSLSPSAQLSIAEVDYTSVSSLTAALKGVSVVVSTLASAAVSTQQPLIDASLAAGVSRFIPSEFGSNTANAASAKLPVFAGKVATEKYLKTLSAANPSFSYTGIINSAFLDWGLAVGFIVNPAQRSAVVYDGGDRPFSTSRLSTIAAAVNGVIAHQAETKNRLVYVHDCVTTQNKLIAYAKKHDPANKEWNITPADTQETAKASYAELGKEKPDFGKAMVGFLPAAIYGEANGGDFSGSVDNDLLGIKGLTEAELEELVASYVK